MNVRQQTCNGAGICCEQPPAVSGSFPKFLVHTSQGAAAPQRRKPLGNWPKPPEVVRSSLQR
eukprot:5426081-Alexandrium_andersonii.AAC.1